MKLTIAPKILFAAALSSVSIICAQTEDLPYDSGSTGADGAFAAPVSFTERYGHSAAYDSGSNQIVVFGGRRYNPNSVYYSETIVFDGVEWSLVDTNTSPSARYFHEMVYDPVRDVVLMFGGLDADGVRLNDTWAWDGTDWTALAPANSPEPRFDHEMVWDSIGQRVILFGGGDATTNELTDLWEWDGTNWTEIAVTSSIRSDYYYEEYDDLVFDSANNRLVLFNEGWRQTYEFDLATLAWSTLPTSATPDVGTGLGMAYDPVSDEIILCGGSSKSQTWLFKNNDWTLLSPENPLPFTYHFELVYNSSDNRIYRVYGRNNTTTYQDTYAWNGTDWEYVIGRNYFFDMTEKADGIWNYTSILVPSNVDVVFEKNVGNTPVVWLATDNVQIDGRVFVSAQSAFTNSGSGEVAIGGPGGFNGGSGGVRFDISGAYIGTSGQGPGGGIAPTSANAYGQGGRYAGTYGNQLIQPLIGGSGGSGASSSGTANGGNGGAGAGAILIASSRDITVDGGIYANGGNAQSVGSPSNARYGGGGSGGAIRLVADRVLGSGILRAVGGDSYAGSVYDGGPGRIRVEGFYRPLAPNSSPTASASAPILTDALVTDRRMWIADVAGEPVGDNPTGSLISPDIIFSQSGQITITVQSVNIPVGTPVKVRVNTSEGVLNLPGDGLPDVTLDGGGMAVFTVTVPAGLGTIQATAEFTVDGTP